MNLNVRQENLFKFTTVIHYEIISKEIHLFYIQELKGRPHGAL